MVGYVRVGTRSDFPEGRGRAVQVEDRRVAVFRIGGRLTAIQDDCPHMGASLADGKVADGAVACIWHGWLFDLESGRGRPPAKSWACARVYEVREVRDEVFVRKPDPPEPPPEEQWPVWDDEMLKE